MASLDFCRNKLLVSTEQNHTSAILHATHVNDYIQEEVGFRAMIGPFKQKPCPLHVSPLMVRDKQDSLKKVQIIHLIILQWTLLLLP